jgi:aldose sugar dehydrogenase
MSRPRLPFERPSMPAAAFALAATVAACGGGSSSVSTEAAEVAPSALQCVAATDTSNVRTERVVSGLADPWALAFLPDGRLLVTLKAGSMVLLSADGTTRTAVSWDTPAPAIRDGGQGGLLDVALDPDFATTPWVYFAYQEPGANGTSGTAVGRARLDGARLRDFQRLHQQSPKVAQDGTHFGARLAFGADKTLFVSLGERGQDGPTVPEARNAQDLNNTLGKIIRLHRDGSVPADNPFTATANARPEIWTLGHRNPQGLAVDEATGELWSSEHGPQGGDEINRIVAGANHGWPVRSYGCPYGAPVGEACRIGGGVHAPVGVLSFTEPVAFWAPTSTAPSNLVVYRGSGFPEWRGQLFMGAMMGKRLWRIELEGNRKRSCETLLGSLNQRIRDVRQGRDGWLWVVTDEGEIHRVVR